MASRSRALRRVLLSFVFVATLARCGVLPQTGPPEGDFYERGDHGKP